MSRNDQTLAEYQTAVLAVLTGLAILLSWHTLQAEAPKLALSAFFLEGISEDVNKTDSVMSTTVLCRSEAARAAGAPQAEESSMSLFCFRF